MRATSRTDDGPAPASAAASAIDGSPNIAITLGEFVAARKEALPQNLAVEKDERQAKRFCRAGEARLAPLGLVREKGRRHARAGRRGDGAFDESDDGFAGAAFFAADADRDGGFAGIMGSSLPRA